MSLYDSPHSGGTSRNLLLALVLCLGLLFVSDLLAQRFLGHPLLGAAPPATATAPASTEPSPTLATLPDPATPQPAAPALRLPLANTRVEGLINLRGGALDTLRLTQYRAHVEAETGFDMLTPKDPAQAALPAEYLVAGWHGAGIQGPNARSDWQPEADLPADAPLTLVWRNDTGQSFQRTWRLRPESYLWEVTERVVNTASLPVTLTPYAQLVRTQGQYEGERSTWVNYFGPKGLLTQNDQTLLKEVDYGDLEDDRRTEVWQGTGGWWGFTSQYFTAAIIPPERMPTSRQFSYAAGEGTPTFTAGVMFAPQVVPANGGVAEVSYLVYAGPKQYGFLKEAGADLEQAIAWGWFEPLVKGLYYVLIWLHSLFPNWGVAVIGLTLLLKIFTFPLANTSYRAMAKMKKLQPEVENLKKKHGDNQQAMAMAMMALYKEQKVNPLSGCWPMLIQIPIFFAMYKVVLIMFEFRHAEFLWLTDLATYDPWFVLPLLMGASMWAQFKLNPKPADPMQEAIFKWMPLMMTVLFLFFPAGLVLYWLVNNLLSIAQQAYMLRKEKAL